MGVKVRAPCSVAFTLQISRGKKYTWTNVHKDAIFNSFTVGCIPISLSLINACAFDRPVPLCSWVVFVHWTEPSDSGPTTPLPNKKLLLFILDRLQK